MCLTEFFFLNIYRNFRFLNDQILASVSLSVYNSDYPTSCCNLRTFTTPLAADRTYDKIPLQ